MDRPLPHHIFNSVDGHRDSTSDNLGGLNLHSPIELYDVSGLKNIQSLHNTLLNFSTLFPSKKGSRARLAFFDP